MKGISWKTRRLSAPDLLLGAAAEVFAGEGYAGATLSRVARRAGVNPALVSYHFGGKAGLREAVLSRLEVYLRQPGGPAASAGAWLDDLEARLRRQPPAARLLLREALDSASGSGGSLVDRLALDLAGRLPPGPGRPEDEARRRLAAVILPLALRPGTPVSRQDASGTP